MIEKRFFLSLAMFALGVLSVSANAYDDDDDEMQGIPDQRSNVVKLGIFAGATLSSMSNYDAADLGLGSGTGFLAGAAMNIHFGKKRGADPGTGPLGIQVEALYVNHTVKTSGEDIKLNYFEVPVLLKYYVQPGFSIEAGPNICGTLSKSPDDLKLESAHIALKDIKGFDVKATVGMAYETKSGFTANVRYHFGTSDLAGNFPCKVSALTVSVGWLFDVFKF